MGDTNERPTSQTNLAFVEDHLKMDIVKRKQEVLFVIHQKSSCYPSKYEEEALLG